jgi:hypothetical protein
MPASPASGSGTATFDMRKLTYPTYLTYDSQL